MIEVIDMDNEENRKAVVAALDAAFPGLDGETLYREVRGYLASKRYDITKHHVELEMELFVEDINKFLAEGVAKTAQGCVERFEPECLGHGCVAITQGSAHWAAHSDSRLTLSARVDMVVYHPEAGQWWKPALPQPAGLEVYCRTRTKLYLHSGFTETVRGALTLAVGALVTLWNAEGPVADLDPKRTVEDVERFLKGERRG